MTSARATDYRLQRLDASQLALPNAWEIPVRLFAGEGVLIERTAVTELLGLLELQDTIAALARKAPELFDYPDPGIVAVALSSDFHKGSGIPIGTTLRTRGVLVPQAVGTDVNCGMRVHLAGWTLEQVQPVLDQLERRLRHLFFQGGRHIGLTSTQREALLRAGVPGLLESEALTGEAWEAAADELARISGGGGYSTELPAGLRDYVGSSGGVSYDTQIGSIGGGNHFVELQVVAKLHDRATAHAWGIREGQLAVMVHTGSLGFGHTAWATSKAALQALLPASFTLPANGILPLPLGERSADAVATVRAAHRAAANFAFGNRFYLARMMLQALAEVAGERETTLLWDSPHNLLWEEESGEAVHRKGSTPARGAEAMADTPFPWGEPVIVPGSMGAPSFILRGLGKPEALFSACHGAGRALARGAAASGHDEELDAFLSRFRVVTPVEPQQLRERPDIRASWRAALKEEAPFAYKAIGPVIETLRHAEVAQPVAELHPVLTVKG
jgi:tRNA-splicing ligase RtcB